MAFGAGGTLVELLADGALRIHPLTDSDIDDIVQQTRVSKLLRGVRGTRPADIAPLKEITDRLSVLLEICPEIRELDINPSRLRAQPRSMPGSAWNPLLSIRRPAE